MRARSFACLFVLVFLLTTSVSADSIQLMLQRGPGAGQATLNWSGAPAPYEVYRSPSAPGIVAPPNWIAAAGILRTTPDQALLFWRRHAGWAMRGNGTREAGEQCDDGNLIRPDGCAPTVFEQVQRAIWFKMQFTTDAARIRTGLRRRRFGQSQLQGTMPGSRTAHDAPPRSASST
jgi:cysteine-rich repeat protein